MEFLFSKDVREIIRKLRADNALNELALQNLTRYFQGWAVKAVGIILFPLLFILLGMEGKFPWLLAGVFAVSLLTLFVYEIRTLPQKIIPLFFQGNYVEGIVDREYRNTGYVGSATWGVYYHYSVNGKQFRQKLKNVPNIFWLRHYKKNEPIRVFFDQKNPENSIPDIQNLGAFFNLVKER
ncbi:MAG: hypothetical protein EA357_05985 [Micavibrio sp.]|nr:MAG: hypothetical protein EA357_05985 [Micavibrio sp.]